MIGLFDSGVGGLTIFKEIKKMYPEYDYIYFSDQANLPYGSKTNEEIIHFTKQAVDKLRAMGCKLIILACHTASNTALRELQAKYYNQLEDYEFKLLGVTIPIVEEAVEISKNRNIGIMATKSSVRSGIFDELFDCEGPDFNVYSKEAQMLVTLIEEGNKFKNETDSVLKRYLNYFHPIDIDTMILGCTHFPFLINEIREILNDKITVIDSGKVVAKKLKKYLEKHPQIEKQLTRNGQIKFYSTRVSEHMYTLSNLFSKEIKYRVETMSLD